MYKVQGYAPLLKQWLAVEETSSTTQALGSFSRWVLMHGTATEYRLIQIIGAGAPTVICANSARGFEVGE